jgi:hypothetical protein
MHNHAYSHTEQLIIIWLAQHCGGSEAGIVFAKNSEWLNTKGKKAFESIYRLIPEESSHAVEYRVVNEFMGKIARGLYFHITNSPFMKCHVTLSFNRDIISYSASNLKENKELRQYMRHSIVNIESELHKEGTQGVVICRDVFSYMYVMSNTPLRAIFKFICYERFEFFVVLDGKIYHN